IAGVTTVCMVSRAIVSTSSTDQPVTIAANWSRVASICSEDCPAVMQLALANVIWRASLGLMRPLCMNSLPKEKADEVAMIVLSRSKNAAMRPFFAGRGSCVLMFCFLKIHADDYLTVIR